VALLLVLGLLLLLWRRQRRLLGDLLAAEAAEGFSAAGARDAAAG